MSAIQTVGLPATRSVEDLAAAAGLLAARIRDAAARGDRAAGIAASIALAERAAMLRQEAEKWRAEALREPEAAA